MKAVRRLVVLATFVAAQAALAQGTATPPPMDKKVMAMDAKTAIVNGVRLSKICDACGVVNTTRVEKRKGDAKGVGAVSGAVVGGVVGKQVGDSKTSTVVGAGVGGVLGHQIERRMKREKFWITTVTLKNGTTKDVEAKADPKLTAGTVVQVGADGTLTVK